MTNTVTSKALAIACTLAHGDLQDRLTRIAELARGALRAYTRHDLVLELRYAPEAAQQVREMVRAEQECCAFLMFDLQENPQEVRLTITAPEEAREAADALFQQFISADETSSGAGNPARKKKSVLQRELPEKGAATAAFTTATGAVVCGVCCVLPFAFPSVALAGAGSAVAWLAGAHAWMTGLAVVIVAAAWFCVWRQSQRSGVRPARSTLYLMGLATAILSLALLWPKIEPQLIRALT